MAELHAVDVDAAGLADLGNTDGFSAGKCPGGTMAGDAPRPVIPFLR
jgi:hypothetical protein